MLKRIRHQLVDLGSHEYLVFGYIILCVMSAWIAVASGLYFLLGLPVLALVVFQALVDYRPLFYLLIICLPFSTEIVLPGGFGTDLPSEPLMIGLMLIFLLQVIQKGQNLNARILIHPITLLLLLHLSWVYISSVTSNLFFVSLKFSLAKTWYIIVFYFLAAYIFKDLKEQKKFFWLLFIPLLITVSIIMVRHAGRGFSFVGIHKVLHPFQRNHVNYAAMLTLFFPFMWFAWQRQEWQSKRWWFLLGSLGFFVLAIYLSFTRAAYIALFLCVPAYFIFRWRLIRYAIVVALIGAVIGLNYLIQRNQFLEYAPNYDRTVTHYEFGNLVEATYKMEDISTMERLHRWVAGFRMSPEEPWVGFGPGNFVNFYKSYTLTSFQTYVSDNPDKSGIHSYFLMLLVEQGIIGLLIYLVFSFFLLIRGERIYHQTKDKVRKGIVMSALLCLVVIDAFLLINDLIETDKVGPFLFICAGLLVNIDFYNQDSKKRAIQADV